jgi:hypothetical protein
MHLNLCLVGFRLRQRVHGRHLTARQHIEARHRLREWLGVI